MEIGISESGGGQYRQSLSDNVFAKINFWRSLRFRFLLLIFASIISIEFLVFVPSSVDMRQRWLKERFDSVEVISQIILNQAKDAKINPKLRNQVLLGTDGLNVTIVGKSQRQVLAFRDQPQHIDQYINLDRFNSWRAAIRSITTLFSGGNQILLISKQLKNSDLTLELAINDRDLQCELLRHWLRFSLISLTLALITSPLVFAITRYLLVHPLQRIFENLLEFVREPNNPHNIIIPGNRHDEVGLAQSRIAVIERELQASYAQQKHLADLGLAVSKINHDMRNILASAKLMSHYLREIDDPRVKKLTPRLIKAIDHAIQYSESVITYGRTKEPRPQRRMTFLHRLVQDVQDALVVPENLSIEFRNDVPKSLTIYVDPEQFHRVILNLCRNAIQALSNAEDEQQNDEKVISVNGRSNADITVIDIVDNGPGLPAKAIEHLFIPFQGSTKTSGSGLGLAICAELVHAHGGTIKLVDDNLPGTHFEIMLPNHSDTKT